MLTVLLIIQVPIIQNGILMWKVRFLQDENTEFDVNTYKILQKPFCLFYFCFKNEQFNYNLAN